MRFLTMSSDLSLANQARVALLSLLVFALPALALADGVKTYTPAAGSTLAVDGTSTLHAWTMNAKAVKALAISDLKASDPQSLKGLKVVVPLATLASKEEAMDKNMQKAMNAKDFPEVTYTITGVAASGNALTLSGDLSFAGATKPLTLAATATPNRSAVTLDGSVTLPMSNWGVKPPVIMGFIKVGDNVVVKFHIILQP